MIDHGNEDDGSPKPTAAARSIWRSHVPDLTVDDVCGCGLCPSVSLTKRSAPAPNDHDDRVVLAAELSDVLVLLFIDGGIPSYLELAPHDDQTAYTEFPDAATLSF